MLLEIIQKAKIVDNLLEKLIIEQIGEGKKDVFIGDDSYFKEVISNNLLDITNSLELGECEINGVKAVKKLGVVYISDKNLDFFERNNKIYSVVPAFKSIKDETEITSKEHITIYNQYKLRINADNCKKYDFIVVSYTEAL